MNSDKEPSKQNESENSQDATDNSKGNKKDDDDEVSNPQFETAPASTEESQEDHTQVLRVLDWVQKCIDFNQALLLYWDCSPFYVLLSIHPSNL